jgi:hypothetical protein
MKGYKQLIKNLADMYAVDIRQKPSDFQKLLAFEIAQELDCSLSEQRIIEGTKQAKENRK